MADDRRMKRYRRLYAALLRLYPGTFRDRFAESMEQTFHDLCRERHATGPTLFVFVLGLLAETSASIVRERSEQIMPPRKNLMRLALVTASILAVPLVAMQFSDEVDWSPFDFIVAGALLFGAGLGFELVGNKVKSSAYRAATALAFAAGLLLLWMNLAVGLIGSEDNPANLLYLGVLVVAIAGGFAARLRPRKMARALYATAFTQALVPVLAVAIWRPLVAGSEGAAVLIQAWLLNSFFVVLFIGAGVLFGIAGDDRRLS